MLLIYVNTNIDVHKDLQPLKKILKYLPDPFSNAEGSQFSSNSVVLKLICGASGVYGTCSGG